jgi:hypothetical protein
VQKVEQTYVNVAMNAHNVGFLVYGAIVDNNTSQWAFVPAAGITVAPGESRALSFNGIWSELEITWPGAPIGYQAAQVQNPRETLTVTWSDDPSLGSGYGGAQKVAAPAAMQQILRIPAGTPIGSNFATVPIPTGTHALALIAQQGSPLGVPYISVKGNITGLAYLYMGIPTLPTYQIGWVFAGIDTAVVVDVVNVPVASDVFLIAIFDVLAITGMAMTPSTPVSGPQIMSVNVSNPVGAPIYTLAAPILGLKVQVIDNVLAASATATLIAATAGTITLYGITWHLDLATGNAGYWQGWIESSTGAVVIDTIRDDLFSAVSGRMAGPAHVLNFPGGYALPAGQGLRARSAANPGTAQLSGSIVYTQA